MPLIHAVMLHGYSRSIMVSNIYLCHSKHASDFLSLEFFEQRKGFIGYLCNRKPSVQHYFLGNKGFHFRLDSTLIYIAVNKVFDRKIIFIFGSLFSS